MYPRLKKCLHSGAYLMLIYVSYLYFTGGDAFYGISLTSLGLSALWLGLTYVDLRGLLRSYFDILSRIKVILPMTIGTVLAMAAMYVSQTLPILIAGGLVIAGWATVYGLYRRNADRYRKQGHGPLPIGTWVNPDCEALQVGDLILTSGRIAKRLRETVGHGEIVVEVDGKLCTFTSFMEKGALVQDLREVTDRNFKYGHYIAMRLRKPLDERQKQLIPDLVAIMLEQNAAWKAAKRAQRDSLLDKLHAPSAVRRLIEKVVPVSGYDWMGLFTGRVSRGRWTCIGACLELLGRIGVDTREYGTGLLGLGTGLFDPIMPVRFLDDPAFRLLSEKDRPQKD